MIYTLLLLTTRCTQCEQCKSNLMQYLCNFFLCICKKVLQNGLFFASLPILMRPEFLSDCNISRTLLRQNNSIKTLEVWKISQQVHDKRYFHNHCVYHKQTILNGLPHSLYLRTFCVHAFMHAYHYKKSQMSEHNSLLTFSTLSYFIPSWQLTVSMHEISSLICNESIVKMTILFLLLHIAQVN